MKKLDLEISTLSVEIKVLTLSGKRFTKSVFNQLPERQIFGDEGRLSAEDIVLIGYVVPESDKTKWVLWKSAGVLYKSAMKVFSNNKKWPSEEFWSGLSKELNRHGGAVNIIEKRFTDSDQIFIAI